ncbi:MAG: hypothetical protein CfClM3_0858 [Methanobrevibacter sp. CfCl-M3]
MKYQKNVIIAIILSLLITSNVAAGVFINDGKIFKNSRLQKVENEEQINVTNVTTVNITKNITTDEDESSETIVEKQYEPETITVYCYPSSFLDVSYPYRLYKTVWDASVLNICSLNPKGVFEKEWTSYDDRDFSCLTGYEKDAGGNSVRGYLISVEVA